MSSPDTSRTVPAAGSSFESDNSTFLKFEDADRFKEGFTSFVASGGTHSTGGSLIGTPSSLIAYPDGIRITETGSITYSNDLTTQVAAHFDTTTTVAGWTRVSGTHYVIKETGTLQSAPSGTVLLMTVVTSSGSITSVTDLRVTSPIQGDLDSAVLTSGGVSNLVTNGQFNYWVAGLTSAPTDWVLAGASGTIARETSNVDHSTNAAAVTRSGTDVTLTQASLVKSGGTVYIQGRVFTVAFNARSGAASSMRVRIDDGVDISNSDYHSGGDTYETLSVSHTVNAAATKLDIILRLEASNHTAEFDSVMLVEGSASHPWANAEGDAQLNNPIGTVAPGVNDDTTKGYTVGSRWIDANTEHPFMATDVTEGAAKWTFIGSVNDNYLINGEFMVAERGTSFTAATVPVNSDDTYLLDRWLLLSDGNDVVDVSQETTIVPVAVGGVPGAYSAIKFEVETANKKWGIFQIIESRDSVKMASGGVSLSFDMRTTSAKIIENVRAAVISWDGAADSVTSDIVSSWNAEGADPTLVANWTYENTPTNIGAVVGTWTHHQVADILIDTSGMKNVGVFIWVDDTDASVDDLLYITHVKLEPGGVVTDHVTNLYAAELALCQRYCLVISESSQPDNLGIGKQNSTTQALFFLHNPAVFRSEPTLVVISAVSDYDAITTAATKALTSLLITAGTPHVISLTAGWSGASGATGDCVLFQLNTSGAKLILDAEL